jgi:serine protease Do
VAPIFVWSVAPIFVRSVAPIFVRAVALVALLLCGVPPLAVAQEPAPARPLPRLAQLNEDLQALVARVAPSVVQISAVGYAGLTRESVTSGNLLAQQRAGGSGVIVDAAGYIVTNAHVVLGARRMRVVLPAAPAAGDQSIVRPPGRSLDATLVGLDTETDLAVLKVDATNLPALPLGDSDELRQGHVVFAFGSPLGLDNSVTMGVVSAVGRQRETDDSMVYVQTDAPINPGSSGGPLVDAGGRVVGINTFILSQSGGNQGLGFAAPSNIVRAVYEQIKATGRVRRGTLGVTAQTITPTLAAGLGLTRHGGVILSDVVPGGPGASAGLRPGDIILALDGKRMENARQFDVNLYRGRAGDVVTIAYERDGQPARTSAAVRERPDDPSRFADLVNPDQNLVQRLGILGVDVDQTVAARLPMLRIKGGVLVAARAADAPGDGAGLLPGDLIASVNGQPAVTVAALRTALARLPAGAPCVLHVQRGATMVYVSLLLD